MAMRRSMALLILAAALALPTGALAANQTPKPTISPNPVKEGRVAVLTGTLADRYGNPVVGAKVTVSGGYGPQASGTTGAKGQFALVLRAEHPGRWPVTVQVAGGKPIRFPVELLVEGPNGKVPGAVAPTGKGGGSVKGRAWPPWSRWVAGAAVSAAAGAVGWWLLSRRRRNKWARPW